MPVFSSRLFTSLLQTGVLQGSVLGPFFQPYWPGGLHMFNPQVAAHLSAIFILWNRACAGLHHPFFFRFTHCLNLIVFGPSHVCLHCCRTKQLVHHPKDWAVWQNPPSTLSTQAEWNLQWEIKIPTMTVLQLR